MDRCEAVSGSYRRERRCDKRAVGTFELTRKRYGNEPGEGPITVPLGRLCRRHANLFGGTEKQDPKVAAS